ncbi:MAG TPA: arsenite methyltransferase [Thermoanaerobaculia bacterium]|nr:arsenite methyltransferase [Thermoanaerobaculia bacterium]
MTEGDAVRQEVSAAYARALERAKRGAGGCCGPAAEESVESSASSSSCCAPAAAEPANGGCCGDATETLGAAASIASATTSELAEYGEERGAAPAVASFGCGNPLAFAAVKPGETVVDLGSGPGLDLILAAKRVGPSGLVIGVDMTDAMIEEARRNAARAGFSNIEVRKGIIENLPVAAGTVDWVISNCVINLSPEKPRVFAEIARVLRPGGRFRISDIVVESLPDWIRSNAAAYAACVAGAISEREYIAGLESAGLVDVEVEHRLVYSVAQIRGLVDHDLKSHGLSRDAIEGAFEEVAGNVWSAYFSGKKA